MAKEKVVQSEVEDFSPGWQKRRSDANVWQPEGDSMTEQSHQESCDINFIMKRYEKTGVAPGRAENGRYGDFTGVSDYHSAVNAVMEAEDNFMALNANVRKRFDNDPGKFLEFVQDPKNVDEMIKLGLAEAPAAPDATVREVLEELKSQKKEK